MSTLQENTDSHESQPAQHREDAPHADVIALTPVRLWLRRLFLVAVWFVVYWILSDPWDTWLGIATALAFGIWLYNRVSGRMKLPPVKVKFERVETITLNHILLALLLLVMLANHSELVDLKKATIDVQDSVTDLQNSATENTDAIKSSLDDVTTAIQASQ
jgi:thiol:disulfide interchange protein